MRNEKLSVDYYLVQVYNREGRGFEDIKVYGSEVSGKREARQYAKQFGKIIQVFTIYKHD